jgi:hypothetical protein
LLRVAFRRGKLALSAQIVRAVAEISAHVQQCWGFDCATPQAKVLGSRRIKAYTEAYYEAISRRETVYLTYMK